MDIVCRFCLEPKLIDTDPLIAPCKCAGSVKYVHIQCIKQWRAATQNPDFIKMCQLCLTDYKLPLKHLLEEIPDIHYDSPWFFLSRPAAFICLIHYLSFGPVASLLGKKIIDPPHGYLFPTLPITHTMNIFYLGCSTMAFSLYFAYYVSLIKRVKNRRLYVYHLLSMNVNNICPVGYISGLFISYSMIYVCIYPFGFLFLLGLPRYAHIHKQILYTINQEAEA